jgi:hypothetical protein
MGEGEVKRPGAERKGRGNVVAALQGASLPHPTAGKCPSMSATQPLGTSLLHSRRFNEGFTCLSVRHGGGRVSAPKPQHTLAGLVQAQTRRTSGTSAAAAAAAAQPPRGLADDPVAVQPVLGAALDAAVAHAGDVPAAGAAAQLGAVAARAAARRASAGRACRGGRAAGRFLRAPLPLRRGRCRARLLRALLRLRALLEGHPCRLRTGLRLGPLLSRPRLGLALLLWRLRALSGAAAFAHDSQPRQAGRCRLAAFGGCV